MGATIAAQIFTLINSSTQCKIESIYMWCDSQIVLHWLNSDKKLKQFVANRVAAITKVCPAQWWGYCPSADNPADMLKRGVSLPSLQASKIWTHGPKWIIHEQHRLTWSPTEILHVRGS